MKAGGRLQQRFHKDSKALSCLQMLFQQGAEKLPMAVILSSPALRDDEASAVLSCVQTRCRPFVHRTGQGDSGGDRWRRRSAFAELTLSASRMELRMTCWERFSALRVREELKCH